MLVSQILKMKDDSAKPGIHAQALVTIAPDAPVQEAAALLAQHRIGAVVVCTEPAAPRVEGILSERDIVRALATLGAEALTRPVSGIMTQKVETCKGGENALTVLSRMTNGRFRHLPVVDDAGALVGLVSIGDAVSARLKELTLEREALTGMIMGA